MPKIYSKQANIRPSEILPQALEHTGQGVGSRTGGGNMRLFCFGEEKKKQDDKNIQ